MQTPEKTAAAQEAAQPLNAPAEGNALMLLLSLLPGALVGYGFALFSAIPGIGLVAFTLLFLLLFWLFARQRLQRSLDGLLLLSAALLLILCYGLYDLPQFRLFNAPLAYGLLVVALLRLCGILPPFQTLGELLQGGWLSLRSAFCHMGRAFSLLKKQDGAPQARRRELLLGLFLAIPLLPVLVLLLSSADSVFGSSLQAFASAFSGPQLSSSLAKLFISLFVALMCFSLLYALRHGEAKQPKALAGLPLPALSLTVLLALVNLLYLAFVGVQFAYLFGGAQHAAMAGGWAAYARRGFFELTAIALFNLGLCMYCLKHWPGHRPLRALCGLLILLTGMMLVSALKRMGLYIDAFGLSLLRLLTLWAMAMIALALLLTGLRLVRPAFHPFRILLALTLASYLVLNLASPAGLVARYNVNAFLEGRLSKVDAQYLQELGSDSLPALKRLAASGHAGGQQALEELKVRSPRPWYAWSLSEARLRAEAKGSP